MQVVPWKPIFVSPSVEVFAPLEEETLCGFLAAYSGLTRDAYQLDLRQWVQCCTEHHLTLFGARRADIESFGRDLEARGRARATVARLLCTVACFYRYAEQEGIIRISPAVHVRRPRLDYESQVWTATRSAPCSWQPASPASATTRW
jgi:hypothetical protein